MFCLLDVMFCLLDELEMSIWPLFANSQMKNHEMEVCVNVLAPVVMHWVLAHWTLRTNWLV
jgi:hypothetical protein